MKMRGAMFGAATPDMFIFFLVLSMIRNLGHIKRRRACSVQQLLRQTGHQQLIYTCLQSFQSCFIAQHFAHAFPHRIRAGSFFQQAAGGFDGDPFDRRCHQYIPEVLCLVLTARHSYLKNLLQCFARQPIHILRCHLPGFFISWVKLILSHLCLFLVDFWKLQQEWPRLAHFFKFTPPVAVY